MSDQIFLVGTGSDRIYTCQMTTDGQLSIKNETKTGKGPSWLIYRHGLIYATNEQEDQIEIFKMNEEKLTSLKKISAHGSTPCSLDIDSTGKWMAIANYGGLGPANFVLMKLDENHIPDEKTVQIDTIDGHGPHSNRQDRSHCHQVQFDERYLYGIDLGTDTISIYQYVDGLKLSRARISTQPAAGPRHLLFNHQTDLAYVVNELDSTTNVYRFGSNVELLQSITTRNSNTDIDENTPAELQFTSDGKYLLVSNRGDDNILVYTVDQGLLTIKQTLNIRGSGPRHFTFDPTGKFLLVANQNSNNLICFRYDSHENSFRYVSQLNNLATPQHILFFLC